MTTSTTDAGSGISFTDKAAYKVAELVAAKSLTAEPVLRVYIQGGGCSGFQYGFTFEQSAADDDMVVRNGDVQLIIDPMSFQYLLGSEVDYKEDLQGSRFVINNPNAATTCGCGASFSI